MNAKCECGDPGCPVHKGHRSCFKWASTTLYRIDMYDETGIEMCRECADDALESGNFREGDEE
jgi:hypothetical protein